MAATQELLTPSPSRLFELAALDSEQIAAEAPEYSAYFNQDQAGLAGRQAVGSFAELMLDGVAELGDLARNTGNFIRRHALAAGAVLLSAPAIAGGVVAATAEGATPSKVKPIRPLQLFGPPQVYDGQHIDQNIGAPQMDLTDMTLRRHYYYKKGHCNTSGMLSAAINPDAQLVRLIGNHEMTKTCTLKPDTSSYIVRYTSVPNTVDFIGPLTADGNMAAASVGVKPSNHNATTEVDIHVDKAAHESDAEVHYGKSNIKGQVLEIDFKVINGHETYHIKKVK